MADLLALGHPEGLLFDFDGTLVATGMPIAAVLALRCSASAEEIHFEAWRQTFQNLQYHTSLTPELYQKNLGGRMADRIVAGLTVAFISFKLTPIQTTSPRWHTRR